MKFIFLSTRYMTGGASLNAVMLAKQLADRGHDCEVWFLMKAGELETFDLKTRIFADTTKIGIAGWFKMLSRFLAAMRESQADAIFSFYPLTNILGSLTKFLGGTKVFIASQRNPVQEQHSILYWIEMFCGSTPLYNANVTVSQDVADSCHKHPKAYQKRLKVIHNGVPPLPNVSESIEECRATFNLPENKFLLGSIGRLDPQKNIQLLIEIIPQLPYAHLALAGTGSLEEELKSRCKELNVEDRVHFLGNLPIEKVAKLFKAADIITFATFYEGFGRVLVEAFSVSRPVIASDLNVLREVADDAALFANNSPTEWIEAVESLYQSQELRENLINKGNNRKDNFSLDKMVDNYLETAMSFMK